MDSNDNQDPKPGSGAGLKAKKMGLKPINFKKEEDSSTTQLVKVGNNFQVDSENFLKEKGIVLTKGNSRRHMMPNSSIPIDNTSIDSYSNTFSTDSITNAGIDITKSIGKLTMNESLNKLITDEDALKSANSKKANNFSLKSPIKVAKNSSNQDVPGNNYDGWDNGDDANNNQHDKEEGVKMEDLKFMGDLGSGSQGHVKKMLNTRTNQMIALKELGLQFDDNFLNALKIELNTLMECNTDNVVRCYGAFQKGSTISIALEFMDKGSLADLLKKVGTLSEPIIGLITYQVLKGLEHLHKKMKVIHRDIKPSNLLINSDGFVKIADFGVSGKIEFTMQYKQTWVGTLIYMSPERCRGDKYNFDTDLWSLGLCILECALGKYPYADQGDQSKMTFFDLVDILSSRPTPKLPDTYSDAMRDFVSICLRKEAGTRSTATELLKHPFVRKFALVNKSTFKAWIETV